MIKKIKELDWDIIKLFLAMTGASIILALIFAVLVTSPAALIEYLIK